MQLVLRGAIQQGHTSQLSLCLAKVTSAILSLLLELASQCQAGCVSQSLCTSCGLHVLAPQEPSRL